VKLFYLEGKLNLSDLQKWDVEDEGFCESEGKKQPDILQQKADQANAALERSLKIIADAEK